MKGERRRGRALLRAVADDPYRKLMAIGLAVLMWFIVNNRTQATHTRRLPLVVVGEFFDRSVDQLTVVLGNEQVTSRSFWNGTKEIQNVDITVSGPRFQIDSIREQVLSLVVVRKAQVGIAGNEPADVESFEFTVADFRRDPLLRDIEITMDPPRVRLEFKVEESYTVELPPRDPRLIELAVDPALENRVLRQTASYYPKTLRVVGRGADLAKLEKQPVPLFRARLLPSGVTGNKVSAKVLLTGADLDLRIEPETTIEMDLQPQTKRFTLDVPVFVDDLALPPEQRGLYEPEQATLLVPLNVSGGLLSDLTSLEGSDNGALRAYGRANFRLLVCVDPPDAGAVLPEKLQKQAFLMPSGKMLLPPTGRNEYSLAELVMISLRRKQ